MTPLVARILYLVTSLDDDNPAARVVYLLAALLLKRFRFGVACGGFNLLVPLK